MFFKVVKSIWEKVNDFIKIFLERRGSLVRKEISLN